MRRKPIEELPTHYLQWHDKDGKLARAWRVRLLNSKGYTKDGKLYFSVIPDPRRHKGLHLITDIPEERICPIVPSPAITRMLVDRYELYIRKERGKQMYMLYWREEAIEGAPFQWSIIDVLEVDHATMCDEAQLREIIVYALRPETMSSF